LTAQSTIFFQKTLAVARKIFGTADVFSLPRKGKLKTGIEQTRDIQQGRTYCLESMRSLHSIVKKWILNLATFAIILISKEKKFLGHHYPKDLKK
jgi:hypothetical protein